MHWERNVQAVAPKILVKGHPTLPLVHLLTRHVMYILIALILEIAQMPRRLEISRRVQYPVEEVVGVKEEHRSLGVRGAEQRGEVGETGVPRGDGFGQQRIFGFLRSTIDWGHVQEEEVLRACGVELRETDSW